MVSIRRCNYDLLRCGLFIRTQSVSFSRALVTCGLFRSRVDGKVDLQCWRVAEVRMIIMLIVIYLGGLLTVTFAAHAVGRRLTHRRRHLTIRCW